MRTNREIFILMIALLLAAFVPARPVYAAEEKPALSWDSFTEDGEVALILSGSNFKDIMQFNIEITYDSKLLFLTSYETYYLGEQVQGVHPVFDDSESGRIAFSVFTNDGKLTFESSKVLKLVFHTTYSGSMELAFGLRIVECKNNTGADIDVSCSGLQMSAVAGDAEADYDCGLVGTGTARSGSEMTVELYAYKELSVVSGSFDLNYNPALLYYSQTCGSRMSGVTVSAQSTGDGKLHISFQAEGTAISAGAILYVKLIPVQNGRYAAISMSDLSLEDQYGKPAEVLSNHKLTIKIDGQNTSHIFSIQSPASAYAGDTVTVTLGIKNNEGFNILDGMITYDPKLLELTSAAYQGQYLSAYTKTAEVTTDGTIHLQILSVGVLSGDGNILTCSFRVKSPATVYTYLHFSITPSQDTFHVLPTDGGAERELSGNSDGCALQLLGTKPGTPEEEDGDSTKAALAAAQLSSAAVKSTGVALTWKKVANATGYILYRRTGNGSYVKLKKITKAATLTYMDQTVKNGTVYRYRVKAYSGSVTGSAKNTKIVLWMKRPLIKTLTSKKTKTLLVKAAKNTGATGYQIQISTSSTFKTVAKSVKVSSKSTLNKTVTGLKKNKKYYVRIRAYRKYSGTTYYSVWSAKKSVKTK